MSLMHPRLGRVRIDSLYRFGSSKDSLGSITQPAMPTNTDTQGRMKVTAATVVDDRPCVKCGYNLKGLAFNANCPECGAAVASSAGNSQSALQKRSDWGVGCDNMGDAPIPYLTSLSFGFTGVCIGGMGLLVVALIGLATDIGPLFSAAGALIACAWICSCLVLTGRRPVPSGLREGARSNVTDGSRLLRWSVALTQPFAGIFVGMLAMRATNPAPWVEPVQWAALAIVVIGLIPLSVLLSDFAAWAGDTPMTSRLRGVAWVLAASLSGAVGVEALQSLHFAFVLLTWFWALCVLAWFGGFMVLCFSSLQMVSMTRWAVSNRREAIARDARVLERARAHAVAGLVALDAPDPAEQPHSLLPPPGTPLPGERTTHRVEPGKVPAKPYALEDTNLSG